MKAVSNNFKNNIKQLGKEIDSYVSYTINGVDYELNNEMLNSITPHYEGSILKSVMKQLDLETTQDIPIGTIVNCKFGLKVADNEVEDYRDNYEYIDYGNYIVYSSEKQEEDNTYKIICFDKMLNSMKDYESFATYPITVKNYINALCGHLNLTFVNINDTFVNSENVLPSELYLDSEGNSLGYTFRDVLDELAQITASTICIDDNDRLEIRYVNNTDEIIDEESLKDINVNFGEATKPINTITFKRSGDSDAISVSYPTNLPDDEKNEIVISNNQILNGNNRDEYIDAILNKLLGLTYYINDFTSTGICYLELCDRYNILIQKEGDEQPSIYSCIMLNDEVLITQGLQENIHTDLLEENTTDYSKTDKTDRRINQTYLIVDKQNQTIESVVSQTIDTGNPESTVNKVSRLTQRVGELESEISEIAGLTTSGETELATLQLDNINESEPIEIKIHPIQNSISYLHPNTGLYPSSTTYLKTRTLRFHNRTTNENFDYELPWNLLYYDAGHYDEFILNYKNQLCKITFNCYYDTDGTVKRLPQTITTTFDYPTIELTEGDYTISLLGYSSGYLYVMLMTNNIYTDQFYTKAETNSLISQTSQSIDLSVDTKLSNYSTTTEMNSAINMKANEITSTVSETYATKDTTNIMSSRISQTAKSIDLSVNNGSTSSGITITTTKEDGTTETETGTIQMNGLVKFTDLSTSGSTTINGANIQTGTLSASKITTGTLNGDNVNIKNINADNIKSGTLNANNVTISNLSASKITSGTLTGSSLKLTSSNAINVYGSDNKLDVKVDNTGVKFYDDDGTYSGTITAVNTGNTRGVGIGTYSSNNRLSLYKTSNNNEIAYYNASGGIHAYGFHNISLASKKDNIKEYKENATDIINDTNVYSYNYKKDNNKKEHIGFVIGEGYKTDSKIIFDDAIDLYTVCGIMWKSIQELSNKIKELEEKESDE